MAVHKIVLNKKSEVIDDYKLGTPVPFSYPQKQPTILNFFTTTSLEAIVAKLAAMDGLSINIITTSSFIRESLKQRGYRLPKNNSRVMDLIKSFYINAKQETENELHCIKKNRKTFSITLDEWTTKGNRRYLNINVHHCEVDFNLGLVPISNQNGPCDAEKILELVSDRLNLFNLKLGTDIVAATNDGAAVMKIFGQLSLIINQLCYSHGTHIKIKKLLG